MTLEPPVLEAGSKGRIRQANEADILRAAEQQFARFGFEGVSLETIAVNIGIQTVGRAAHESE